MERSFAARLPLGRQRRRPAGPRRAAAGGRAASLAGSLALRLAALRAAVRARRRVRVALICLALALPVLLGGWMWLRSSPLVSVERVQLEGVRGPQRPQIEAALRAAARHMSTLDVNTAALRAAVAAYPVVRSVTASAQFPHGLRIEVQEQLPVAVLEVDGWRAAVADNGVVLGPAALQPGLPTLQSSVQARVGRPVTAGAVRAELAVVGAAPAPLGRRIAGAFMAPQGLTVKMAGGLLVYFGNSSRAAAKWLALARVLADPSSAGAAYVDVRLPERPAAGFADGVVPPSGEAGSAGTPAASGTETGAGAPPVGGSEATIAALAEGLRGALAGSGGAPVQNTGAPAAGEAAGQSSSPTEASQPAGGAEAAQAPAGEAGAQPAAEAGAAQSTASEAASAPAGGQAAP